jgi:phosphopantetheine adenylyltransferase
VLRYEPLACRLIFTGHAGAMLQARQLGTELYVGIHSDEAILENKGPTVMTLRERFGNSVSPQVKLPLLTPGKSSCC